MKQPKNQNSTATLRRVLALIGPYRLLAITTLLLAALTVTATLLAPVLCGRALDLIIGPGQVDFAGLARLALALVGVAFAMIDFCKATQAVGIGMRANTAGTLSIGLPMDMAEHGIGNLSEPVEDQDAATKSYVDGRIAALAQTLGVTI